jgi:signal transduction histidine kinase
MLEIEDGGRGISRTYGQTAEKAPHLGVGLAGMRERIGQIGGTFSAESTGAGTRVRTTIAIRQARDPTASTPACTE